jgi:hypothetical protein
VCRGLYCGYGVWRLAHVLKKLEWRPFVVCILFDGRSMDPYLLTAAAAIPPLGAGLCAVNLCTKKKKNTLSWLLPYLWQDLETVCAVIGGEALSSVVRFAQGVDGSCCVMEKQARIFFFPCAPFANTKYFDFFGTAYGGLV